MGELSLVSTLLERVTCCLLPLPEQVDSIALFKGRIKSPEQPHKQQPQVCLSPRHRIFLSIARPSLFNSAMTSPSHTAAQPPLAGHDPIGKGFMELAALTQT